MTDSRTTTELEKTARVPGVSRRTFSLAAAGIGVLGALGLPLPASADGDLKTMTGESAAMLDHIVPGKWNLVMLWSVTCGICARETPRLSELYEEEKSGNLTLLGLSIDGPELMPAVQDWMQTNSMSFPNLVGDFATVAANYESIAKEPLRGTPTFLMFDMEGKLAAVNPGPVRPQAVREFIAKRS